MYVSRDIKVRLCNHCCSSKAMSTTQPQCACVALGTQHAMRMRHIVRLWPSSLYNIFSQYPINGTIFGGGEVTEHKMFVFIFPTNFVRNISHCKKN